MIRGLWTLIKIVGVILLLVFIVGKIPDRQINHCTATVTGDDGTVQTMPC